MYEAVEDKQRYIRELQAYQSSKAYRAFLRRRAAHKVQALCGEWGLAGGLQLLPPRPEAMGCFTAEGTFEKCSVLVSALVSIHVLIYYGY